MGSENGFVVFELAARHSSNVGFILNKYVIQINKTGFGRFSAKIARNILYTYLLGTRAHKHLELNYLSLQTLYRFIY